MTGTHSDCTAVGRCNRMPVVGGCGQTPSTAAMWGVSTNGCGCVQSR